MRVRWYLVAAGLLGCAANGFAASPRDADFMLGTWTSEGVCTRSEEYGRQGGQYTSTTYGKVYVGSIDPTNDGFNTSFRSADGASKEYVLRYENENRVRVMFAKLCESPTGRLFPGKCTVVRLDDVEFYYQRCAE
jgi:hypothetical protein